MQISEHLGALQEHASGLASAAEAIGLDQPVPSCPGWTVDDLLAHVGQVHRWATACLTAPPGGGRIPYPDPPPDGRLEWYRDGMALVIETLTDAPDDLAVWTFLPAPSPKAFWTRRQAHETAIHHADVELAGSGGIQYPTEFAIDGIDELLNGFLARPRTKLVADPPVSLLIAPTDADRWWHMTINPDGRVVRSTGETAADTTVSGAASDLYRQLWNRPPDGPVQVDGDQRAIDLWRALATV